MSDEAHGNGETKRTDDAPGPDEGQEERAAEAEGEAEPEVSADAEASPDKDEGAPAPSEDAAQLKDQLLRALAEVENVRRRSQKELADAKRYAIAGFARDVLSVADNLSRALESIPADARTQDELLQSLADGVEMTAREFAGVLERHGIREVNPLGEKFDYNFHQAMFETDSTDQPDGTVVEVAQVGYVIGDRLLRPAMVGVAKGGAGKAGPDKAVERQSGNGGGDEGQENGEKKLGGQVDTNA